MADDTAALATKKDLMDFMQMISDQIDRLYKASETWKDEMKSEMEQLKKEMRSEMQQLKEEVHDEVIKSKDEILHRFNVVAEDKIDTLVLRTDKHDKRITKLEKHAGLVAA